MTTSILVCGAYRASQRCERLVPFPRAAAHELSCPSLTGLGERIHLACGLTFQRERGL
jgi:hypothetical protein